MLGVGPTSQSLFSLTAMQGAAGTHMSLAWVQVPWLHEKEQLPMYPAAQVPEEPPLGVALTSQSLFSVAGPQGAAMHVSVTWVQVPLEHEKEQFPVYPTAQVPRSVLPLFVAERTQLFIVPAAHCAAQVLVTWVQIPLEHEKEQLPVYPTAQVPVSVLPLSVIARTQLFVLPASQGAGAAQVLLPVHTEEQQGAPSTQGSPP